MLIVLSYLVICGAVYSPIACLGETEAFVNYKVRSFFLLLHLHRSSPTFPCTILSLAQRIGVPLAGENALQRYDDYAFNRIAESAFGQTARAGRLEQLTFLRMGDMMFDASNWDAFSRFLAKMRQPPGT